MRLIIHAPNVHRGGGRTLLLSLLDAARRRPSTIALLDQRLEIPEELSRGLTIISVVPTLWGRFAGECALRRTVRGTDRVLCFGNLPPLLKVSGEVFVFLQNRYLVDHCTLDGFPARVKLRLMVERLWLRHCHGHANSFIVQTGSMKQLVTHVLGRAAEVMALSPEISAYKRQIPARSQNRSATYDFLYVATGEPHKNHAQLLEAWKILAADKLYPLLCLTISESDHPHLAQLIEQAKRDYKLNIINMPTISSFDMRQVYGQSKALVYPSVMESFGLPLIEARQAGLPIIASELDYVRDVVDPEETFDPRSPQSIARAIKRYLRIPETPLPVLQADAFVSRLLAV